MSHTREDRIADRPHHLCAAYGCPLLGSMSVNTQGSSDWWCFAHFGKDVGRLQAITSEIRRLEWLANAIVDVRMRSNHADYPAAFQRIEHDLMLAQRKDLRWTEPESEDQWMVRLEREMAVLLSSTAQPTVRQAPLITHQPRETFSKVEFDMPA